MSLTSNGPRGKQPPGIALICVAAFLGGVVTILALWRHSPLLAVLASPLGGSLSGLCVVVALYFL